MNISTIITLNKKIKKDKAIDIQIITITSKKIKKYIGIKRKRDKEIKNRDA